MKNILLVDNYDSFSYNLVQLVHNTGLGKCEVVKNDMLSEINLVEFDGILLSPGPDLPDKSGQLIPFLEHNAIQKPVLGVCLGHQAIASVFNASLYKLSNPVHGHVSFCNVVDPTEVLFYETGSSFAVGRYHSWAIDRHNLPDKLIVTAVSDDNVIMAIRHCDLNIRGIQFHPESVMTPAGLRIIENWIKYLV